MKVLNVGLNFGLQTWTRFAGMAVLVARFAV